MESKNTILSQAELELLEALVLRHGKIVTFAQIQAAAGSQSSASALRQRVAQMSRAGWLVRLRRGLYLVVTDISTLGFVDVSDLVIAQALNPMAYVSFERALQHHALFDQLLARIDAVTTGKSRRYNVLGTLYTFSKIQPELYWGFEEMTLDGRRVAVANPEKALLDILYFRTSAYAVSLVLEKLQTGREGLEFDRLKAHARRYPVGIVRKIGFLLDLAGVDTGDLLTAAVKASSYSRLTQDAKCFNARWRLYYDPQVVG